MILCAACGPSRGPSSAQSSVCPASFAAASGHQCSVDVPDGCTYPDGVCTCTAPRYCGGHAPPDEYGKIKVWECTPLVRPDGCPGVQPADATACTNEGQHCVYECQCTETANCMNGSWSVVRGECAP